MAHHVGIIMKARQYTVRNVPPSVDRALRRRAEELGKSLNALLLDLLKKEAGADGEVPVHTDLDEFIGSWIEDPAVDDALRQLRTVDSRDWE